MAGAPSLLASTLDGLLAGELKRFRWSLSHVVAEGFKPIPRGQLENRDVPDTVDLMVGAYGEEGAVTVTLYVLRKTDQNDLAQTLEKDYSCLCSQFSPKISHSPERNMKLPSLIRPWLKLRRM
ncbi:hypothetical protein MATL_G00219710 [Megalops atlanticus]|uniref:Pyrin domain-containing protein n=1 Tax=Megalops atlanticus TaxID=7932 RepID=A0A9D3SY79_MEGAT|nr:hypothetical protein MATL_G00219710 [Megalops atlanticus]